MWQILLGAAISLVSTLLAQWFSLSYQTKRQQEMRRTDSYRTTLLQLRDALKDLGLCVTKLLVSPEDALQRTGRWEAFSPRHPDVAAVSAAVTPVLLYNLAVQDEPLRLKVEALTERAEAVGTAPSERDADEEQKKFGREIHDVIALLGDQLRRLS